VRPPVPHAVVFVPVEGLALAYLVADNYGDEQAVRHRLHEPGLSDDVAAALDVLREALEDRREAA
jgi:hypothetical protein